MDELVKELRYWSKKMEQMESSGHYTLQPEVCFTIGTLMECAAQSITELCDEVSRLKYQLGGQGNDKH